MHSLPHVEFGAPGSKISHVDFQSPSVVATSSKHIVQF